jgi:hypothetical protein
MILTPLKIQIAIIKAWYSIALKSVKYYAGLTVGINNSCLLKQARLLRKYVEILRNFTIVGSTTECSCCIEGDYTVLLNDLSEATEANIQFGCDNQGYLVFNNVSYLFTYIYDPSNNTLKIDFLDINDNQIIMDLQDIQFTDECNITNTNDLITPVVNAGSQLEVATITVTGIPVNVENEYGNWSGTLEVIADDSTPIYTLTIPASILSDPQAIVDLWNTTYGSTGWLLYYNGTSYVMSTPLEINEFFIDYSIVFTEYQGGSDPGPLFPAQRFRTSNITPLLPSNGFIFFSTLQPGLIIYQDVVAQPYNSVQDIIDTLNENTEFQFSLNTNVSPFYEYIDILAPINSFAYFNGPELSFLQEIIPIGTTDQTSPFTTAFTVTISGIIDYISIIGQEIPIAFTSDNNLNTPTVTLNINGFGAVDLWFNGLPLPSNFFLIATPLNPEVYNVVYDGTNFNILDKSHGYEGLFSPSGVDPTQEIYESPFEVDGNTGTFVNDNPCEATIAEQDCLSNKQVSNIIQHINKLVR